MTDPLTLARLAARERYARHEQTLWRVLYLQEAQRHMQIGTLALDALATSQQELIDAGLTPR